MLGVRRVLKGTNMSKIRVRYSKTGKARYISHLDLMSTMQRAFIRAGVRLKYSEGFNPHPYISVALPLPVGCGSVCELMDIGLMDIGLTDTGFTDTGSQGTGMINAGSQDTSLQADEQYNEIAARVNASLPDGIHINEVYISDRKFSEIAWVQIDGVLTYDNGAPQGAAARLAEHFSRSSIIITKKTKRGTADIDVAPHIRDIGFECVGEGPGGRSSEGLGGSLGEGLGGSLGEGPGGSLGEGPGAIRMTATISATDPTINTGDVMSIINCGPISLKPDYSAFTRLEAFDRSLIKFR